MHNNVKICPKCSSTDVRIEMGSLTGTGKPNPYVCNNCGFMGFVFPETSRQESRKIRVKKPAQVDQTTELVDTSTGKFYIRGTKTWWKIFGPIMILIAVYFVYSSLYPVQCVAKDTCSQINQSQGLDAQVEYLTCIANPKQDITCTTVVPNINDVYLSVLLLSIGVIISVAAYAIPDKMNVKQSKIFGIVIIALFLFILFFRMIYHPA